jgi:hypothetical protein
MESAYSYVLIIVILSFGVVALMNYFTVLEGKAFAGRGCSRSSPRKRGCRLPR